MIDTVDPSSSPAERRAKAWDAIVTLAVRPDHRRITLFVETRAQLTPQTALAAFQKLRWLPTDGQLLVCAPTVSARVAEMCREQGVGYLDAAGNCRIAAPGLFLHVAGRPNLAPPARSPADPFSRKSSRIVRALLTEPGRSWQVQELARAAGVSLGLVSKVKDTLLQEAYLEEHERRLRLRDPAQLLRAWSARYRPPAAAVPLFALSRLPETETRLADWCRAHAVNAALTQLAAAWRYSPAVRYDRTVAYVDRKVTADALLPALRKALDAREVDTGANCALWLTDDPAVFTGAREVGGVTVVSPLQLYLDLKALPGRGEEAAEELLRAELRFPPPPGARDGSAPGGHHE